MMPLVSIHIPKTGGSTLLSILQQVYANRLQLAYGDERDAAIEEPQCYHGHAVLDVFGDAVRASPNAKWLTFLRDPLRSAISLYHYGVKRGDVREVGLRKWLTGQGAFCWPDPPNYNHNRMSKWVERAKGSWSRFDMIGVTEYFDESIQMISRALAWPDFAYTPQNVGTYAALDLEVSVVEDFKHLNKLDYSIYNRVVGVLKGQPDAAQEPR